MAYIQKTILSWWGPNIELPSAGMVIPSERQCDWEDWVWSILGHTFNAVIFWNVKWKKIYEFRVLIKDSKYAKGIEVERKNKQMEKSLCGASWYVYIWKQERIRFKIWVLFHMSENVCVCIHLKSNHVCLYLYLLCK